MKWLTLFIISNKACLSESFKLVENRKIGPNLNLRCFIHNQRIERNLFSEFCNKKIGKHAQGAKYNLDTLKTPSIKCLEGIRSDDIGFDVVLV